MKRYKLTYPLNFSPSGAPNPQEILRQVEASREAAETGLAEFLRRENLAAEVQSIYAVPHQPALVLTCSDNVAQKLKGQGFVESIEEDAGRALPAHILRPPQKKAPHEPDQKDPKAPPRHFPPRFGFPER
jgi:hypothetical protein